MAFPNYARLKNEPIRIKRLSAVRRTDMESGPPKQTKTASRVMVQRQLTYVLISKADYASFIQWFATDAARGSAWFAWTDPVDGVEKQARIADGSLEETGSPDENDVWEIGMTIETWDA